MHVKWLRPITWPQAYLNYMRIAIDRTRHVPRNRNDRMEMIRKVPRIRKRVCVVGTQQDSQDMYAISIAW